MSEFLSGLEKRKNLYLIKLVSNWKREIRKGHRSFLFFHFWDLKLVHIDSTLNCLSVSRAAKLENTGINLFNKFTTFSEILILILSFVTLPCFLAKIAQILQICNCAFPGKRIGDKTLILTYLHNPIAKVFPQYCLSFSINGWLKSN